MAFRGFFETDHAFIDQLVIDDSASNFESYRAACAPIPWKLRGLHEHIYAAEGDERHTKRARLRYPARNQCLREILEERVIDVSPPLDVESYVENRFFRRGSIRMEYCRLFPAVSVVHEADPESAFASDEQSIPDVRSEYRASNMEIVFHISNGNRPVG